MKRKKWRIFKVLLFLFLLLSGSLLVYILNIYKQRIPEKSVFKLIKEIKCAPDYSNKVYNIVSNIELDTNATLLNTLFTKSYHTPPSVYLSRNTIHFRAIHVYSLAIKLDRHLSPKEMTNKLLQNIPFANNVKGLDSACRMFLKKQINEASDRELISICAIIKANTLYNPIRNPRANKERTTTLINQLRAKGIQLDSSCD